MDAQSDPYAETLAHDDEDETPILAWSLDELDSDLDSVRSALGRADA